MAKKKTKTQNRKAGSPPKAKKSGINNWYWLILVFSVLVALFIRFRLTGIPLERDEGDYATNAMLLLDGVSLDSQLIMKRFTLIYYLYMGFLTIFGHSDTGIHLGLLVFNLASIGGMYLLGSELKDQRTGVLSAALFSIFSLSYTVNGVNANREHFLVFFAIIGIWYLLKALKSQQWWKYFLAGLLIGASFAVKQHGAMFLLFGGLWLIYYELVFNKAPIFTVIRNGAIYSIGGLLLFGLIMLQYKVVGAFEGFYENTFQSSSYYVQTMGPQEGWQNIKTNFTPVVRKNLLFFLLVIPGLAYAFRRSQYKMMGAFLVLLALISAFATVPGWYFRPHYFMILVPAVTLLAAAGIMGIRHYLSHRIPVNQAGSVAGIILLATVIQPLVSHADYYFDADDVEASRIVYQYNPFPEAEVIGDFIQRNTQEGDKIMVMGSEPELYFYANRHPAISSYYMYRLMRPTERASQQQQSIMAEAEANPPAMIAFYDVPVSWLKTKESDNAIFDWLSSFVADYQQVGTVDILPGRTNYVFGPEARNYKPRSTGKIYLFQRSATP